MADLNHAYTTLSKVIMRHGAMGHHGEVDQHAENWEMTRYDESDGDQYVKGWRLVQDDEKLQLAYSYAQMSQLSDPVYTITLWKGDEAVAHDVWPLVVPAY